jgi:hypothetical protein
VQGMHRPQQFPVLDKGPCQWVLAGASSGSVSTKASSCARRSGPRAGPSRRWTSSAASALAVATARTSRSRPGRTTCSARRCSRGGQSEQPGGGGVALQRPRQPASRRGPSTLLARRHANQLGRPQARHAPDGSGRSPGPHSG